MVFKTTEKEWATVEDGISKLKQIIGDEAPGLEITVEEKMAMYTAIYDICVHKSSADLFLYTRELYKRYKAVIDEYVSSTVLPSLRRGHHQFLLKQLVKMWENHKLMVRWMNYFFSYLDRYFVPRCTEVNKVGFEIEALKPLGWRCFAEPVYETTNKRVAAAVIQLINRERDGEQIDRSLVKKVLDLLVEMGEVINRRDPSEYYVNGFEEAFLEDTAEYYSRKAARWMADDSLPDYLLKAEECLKKEKDRAAHLLQSKTEPKLMEIVQAALLSNHEKQLLEKEPGCLVLLKNNKVDDLTRMYRLFAGLKTPARAFMAQIFKQHVADEGMALLKQAEESITDQKIGPAAAHNFVTKMIEHHNKYLGYVSTNGCFNNDTLFHKALNESFHLFFNKSAAGSTTAELLVNFSDRILKKGSPEKLSHDAIEETIESVVRVLAYILDKDLFGEFYRKKLARRLLFDASSSDEQERSMLLRLKQQCGGQFTSKMEGMLTDIALAREKQNQFAEYLNAFDPKTILGGVDLNVTVLTTGFWPSYKSHDVNLPKEMINCVNVFREYYQSTITHKKLSWIYSLGSCNIVGHFEKKPVELIVTTYQACVLMLFNSCDRLSYSEIITQLNLDEEDVIRLLHSLSCARYKILNKEPNTQNISRRDVFEFNSQFTDKMRRIKIPLPPVDEKKKVMENVNNDRRYAIDATIVRIMKSRKVLNYQQLVAQCVEQLSPMFKPDLKMIKKRIEDLIIRDYLARDEKDSNTFKYLA